MLSEIFKKMKPDEGYISYIVNPKSGASSSKLKVWNFHQYLIESGFDVKRAFTQSLKHAGELATNAVVDYNCTMVIVCGGDGTVREIAHALEGSDKVLMIVPAGTENLLASELGYDEQLRTLQNVFDDGEIKPLDLCSANGKMFTSIAGFGIDGDIVKLVDKKRQGHISYLDYFWPIWQSFWNYKFPAMRVKIDGEEVFEGRGLVFAGNISRYAAGLQILHYADYSDGLLDVCIYKCASQLHLVKHSMLTVMKKHADRGDVIYRQCKKVRITSDNEIRTEMDGDPGVALPVDIEIMPQAIKVLVPRNAKPAGIRTRIRRVLG